MSQKSSILVQGMHGFGDTVHQRAVVRQLMKNNHVILECSWPSLFHDLVGDDLTVVRRQVGLRTQTKNAEREIALFGTNPWPAHPRAMRVRYGGAEVMACESKTVLEAMCNVTGVSFAEADYTLPVPDAWTAGLFRALGPLPKIASERPWLVYRPLVARTEWRGSMARNADPLAYAKLFQLIRDTFFVVSVADLEPGREWIVGPELHADMAFHQGELVCESLAALFKHADLIYTSSGFPAILGPAVGTPVLNIVGGYEDKNCHNSGQKFAPMLALGPAHACTCWSSQCRLLCDKTLDMDASADAILKFMSEIPIQISDNVTPFDQMFSPWDGGATQPTTGPATVIGAAQSDQLLQQMRRSVLRSGSGGLKA